MLCGNASLGWCYSVAIDKQIKEEQHMGKGTRSKKSYSSKRDFMGLDKTKMWTMQRKISNKWEEHLYWMYYIYIKKDIYDKETIQLVLGFLSMRFSKRSVVKMVFYAKTCCLFHQHHKELHQRPPIYWGRDVINRS